MRLQMEVQAPEVSVEPHDGSSESRTGFCGLAWAPSSFSSRGQTYHLGHSLLVTRAVPVVRTLHLFTLCVTESLVLVKYQLLPRSLAIQEQDFLPEENFLPLLLRYRLFGAIPAALGSEVFTLAATTQLVRTSHFPWNSHLSTYSIAAVKQALSWPRPYFNSSI